MTKTPTTLTGYHHLTLNIQDVEKSEQWYRDVLGITRLTTYATDDFQGVILRHPASGMMLGLNRHASEAAEPFSERRAGLKHVAFLVADRDALEAWVTRFNTLNVPHSEIKPGAVPGSFRVAFRDPDGIQLEIFAPPAARRS
jgi:glyoxylase I family protein